MYAELSELMLLSRLNRVALLQALEEWKKFRSAVNALNFSVDQSNASIAYGLIARIEAHRDKIDTSYEEIGANLVKLLEAIADLGELTRTDNQAE